MDCISGIVIIPINSLKEMLVKTPPWGNGLKSIKEKHKRIPKGRGLIKQNKMDI